MCSLDLCVKVGKALKDSGGASSEYQHVIIELGGLEKVLAHLEALEPSENNVHHVNAIRGMALGCQFPLRDFLDKIWKYESTMGPFASKSFRGAGQKAKWAIFIAEEVRKLRAVISIDLLLATHAS